MKIIVDAHMVGEQETGNESYVVNLIRGLQAENSSDHYFIATAHPEALALKVKLTDQFSVVAVSASPYKRIFHDLPRLVKTIGVDLLHVTYTGPWKTECPIVVTVHDLSFTSHPEWFSLRDRLVLKSGVWWTVRKAARVITISNYSRVAICSYYRVDWDRVAVTPLAADRSFQKIDGNSAWQQLQFIYPSLRQPFILAVGNIQPRKNIVRLLEAYCLFKRRTCATHLLVIIGKSLWRESEVEAAVARLGITQEVVFAGYVPDEHMPLFYNAAEMLVFPSLYEGFGLPILEAMQCGLPVLASNVSAMPEIAGMAAVLVDPHNVKAIADGMETIIKDHDFSQRLREEGIRQARKYSWVETARLTLDAYHQAAKSGMRK